MQRPAATSIRSICILLDTCLEELDQKRRLSDKLLVCAEQLKIILDSLRTPNAAESDLANVFRPIILGVDRPTIYALDTILYRIAEDRIAAIECAHFALSDENTFEQVWREHAVREARDFVVMILQSLNKCLGSTKPSPSRTFLRLVPST